MVMKFWPFKRSKSFNEISVEMAVEPLPYGWWRTIPSTAELLPATNEKRRVASLAERSSSEV